MASTVTMSIILGVILLLVMWRWYQVYATTSVQESGFVLRIVLSSALVTVGQSVGNYTAHTWVGLAVPAGILLSYAFIEYALTTTPRVRPLHTDPFCVGVGIVILIQVPFFYLRGDIGLLFHPGPFTPSWLNYGTHLSYFSTLLVLQVPIATMFFRRGSRTDNLTYKTRCFLGMGTYLLGIISALFMILSLHLVWWVGDQYRMPFNAVFHGLGVLAVSILLLSIAPERVIQGINRPLLHYRTHRQAHEQQRLTYLHARMLHLAPQVHLPVMAPLQSIRQLTEIGDARDLLLSHAATQPTTALEEAHYLYTCLDRNQVIDQIGPYLPQPVAGDVKQHYVAVAHHLYTLERGTYDIPAPVVK